MSDSPKEIVSCPRQEISCLTILLGFYKPLHNPVPIPSCPRNQLKLIVAESVENHLRSDEDHEDRKREHESLPFECDYHHTEGVNEEDACPYEQNGIDRQYSVPEISHKGIIQEMW